MKIWIIQGISAWNSLSPDHQVFVTSNWGLCFTIQSIFFFEWFFFFFLQKVSQSFKQTYSGNPSASMHLNLNSRHNWKKQDTGYIKLKRPLNNLKRLFLWTVVQTVSTTRASGQEGQNPAQNVLSFWGRNDILAN